jgi:hypothetical protein
MATPGGPIRTEDVLNPGHGSPGARHRADEGTETRLVLSHGVGERIVIDGGSS